MSRAFPLRASRRWIGARFVLAASLLGCATEGTLDGAEMASPAPPAPHRRLRPRRARVERALAQAAERAGASCLAPGTPEVAVEGAFVGANGRFAVTAVRAIPTPPPERVECVSAIFAEARVPPFRALRYDAAQVVTPAPAGAAGAAGGSAPGSNGAAVATMAGATTTTTTTSNAPPPSAEDAPTREARARAGAMIDARSAPALLACYRRQLADDGALRAWFQMRFVIDRDGRVAFAGAATRTLAGGPRAAMHFAECAEEVVRTATFPGLAPPRTFELLRAFMLSPESGATTAP